MLKTTKRESLVHKLSKIKMLSTKYRLELTDICCRMITQDGVPVTLKERIWLSKLCEKNASARELAGALLCPNTIGEDVIYYE